MGLMTQLQCLPYVDIWGVSRALRVGTKWLKSRVCKIFLYRGISHSQLKMTLFGILPRIPTFQQLYHSLPTLAELPQGRVKHEHTAAARVQALTLLHCTPGPPSNEKYDQIYRMIGIPPRSLRQISHTARTVASILLSP